MSDRSDVQREAAFRGREDGLAEQVVAFVREHIAQHGLRPGDPLPGETGIARALGVSRPVVREASRTLAALGTISTAPGRVPRVGGMQSHALRQVFEHAIVTGQADARQVLEMRRGIEIAMAGQAAQRRTETDVKRLAALSDAMGGTLHDPDRFVAHDLDFHLAVAQATENPFYVVLVDACRAAFAASMDLGLRHRFTGAELTRVQRLHAEIVDGIARADAAAAADAMTRHFDDALAALYRPGQPGRDARKR